MTVKQKADLDCLHTMTSGFPCLFTYNDEGSAILQIKIEPVA